MAGAAVVDSRGQVRRAGAMAFVLLIGALVATLGLDGTRDASADQTEAARRRASATEAANTETQESHGQVIEYLSLVTATELAQSLVGSGVTVSSATFIGSSSAARRFSGLDDLGFSSGI